MQGEAHQLSIYIYLVVVPLELAMASWLYILCSVGHNFSKNTFSNARNVQGSEFSVPRSSFERISQIYPRRRKSDLPSSSVLTNSNRFGYSERESKYLAYVFVQIRCFIACLHFYLESKTTMKHSGYRGDGWSGIGPFSVAGSSFKCISRYVLIAET